MRSAGLSIWMFLVLVGCSSSKKVAESSSAQPRPQWVSNRPISSQYFIGIGSASVRENPSDFQQVAKQQALKDLTSEIKVDVSSKSVLQEFESDNQFQQDFSDVIRLNIKEQIADFETVGSWEGDGYYWVYYRLSKQVYKSAKQARINKALESAKAYVQRAEEQRKAGAFEPAMKFYYQAFTAIEPVLDEDLKTDMSGKQVYFGSYLIGEINSYLSSIKIKPNPKNDQILWGKLKPENDIVFKLTADEKPLKSASVRFEGRSLEQRKRMTDEHGMAVTRFVRIPTGRKAMEVKCELVIPPSNDPLLRRTLARTPLSTAFTTFKIVMPTVWLDSDERVFGKLLPEQLLKNSTSAELGLNGFKIVGTEKEADFVIRIDANTRQGGNASGFFSAYLNGKFQVVDKEQNEIYAYPFVQVKGVKLEYEGAGMKAYEEAVKTIRRKVIPEMINTL